MIHRIHQFAGKNGATKTPLLIKKTTRKPSSVTKHITSIPRSQTKTTSKPSNIPIIRTTVRVIPTKGPIDKRSSYSSTNTDETENTKPSQPSFSNTVESGRSGHSTDSNSTFFTSVPHSETTKRVVNTSTPSGNTRSAMPIEQTDIDEANHQQKTALSRNSTVAFSDVSTTSYPPAQELFSSTQQSPEDRKFNETSVIPNNSDSEHSTVGTLGSPAMPELSQTTSQTIEDQATFLSNGSATPSFSQATSNNITPTMLDQEYNGSTDHKTATKPDTKTSISNAGGRDQTALPDNSLWHSSTTELSFSRTSQQVKNNSSSQKKEEPLSTEVEKPTTLSVKQSTTIITQTGENTNHEQLLETRNSTKPSDSSLAFNGSSVTSRDLFSTRSYDVATTFESSTSRTGGNAINTNHSARQTKNAESNAGTEGPSPPTSADFGNKLSTLSIVASTTQSQTDDVPFHSTQLTVIPQGEKETTSNPTVLDDAHTDKSTQAITIQEMSATSTHHPSQEENTYEPNDNNQSSTLNQTVQNSESTQYLNETGEATTVVNQEREIGTQQTTERAMVKSSASYSHLVNATTEPSLETTREHTFTHT